MDTSVSIIIVNYKTPELVKECVDSIVSCTKNVEYEIIIIDNSNDQNDREKLNELGRTNRSCRIVFSNENLGFGKANNLGASFAKSRFLFFLNSDTIILPNAILELLYCLQRHPQAGIVGPNLISKDGAPSNSFEPEEVNLKFIKSHYSLRGAFFRKLFIRKKFFNYTNHDVEVFGYVCGAALLIRKSLFDSLGGFDSDIFMYAEDVLLCHKACRVGKTKIFNTPKARIVHLEGGSESCLSEWKAANIARGNAIYFEKEFGKEIQKKALQYLSLYYRKKSAISIFDKSERTADQILSNAFRKELLNSIQK